MKNSKIIGSLIIISVIIASAILILQLGRPTPKPLEMGQVTRVRITVLVDNNPAASLSSPWGVSMFIETDNVSILFDAGPSPRALEENAATLGINLSIMCDLAVLSHEHSDHIDGFSHVAVTNPHMTVCIPANMTQSSTDHLINLGLNVKKYQETTVLYPGVAIIGQLNGPPFEQALAVNVQNIGLVLIVGCSHPGVENILAKAVRELDANDPYLVIGGFHLGSASESVISNTVESLIKLGVQKIYPIHCSGDRIRDYLLINYPDYYGDGQVGFQLFLNGSSNT
ncbi:MAG: MBL fold metallo-hydrolase [Promethearchaeota archaeon]